MKVGELITYLQCKDKEYDVLIRIWDNRDDGHFEILSYKMFNDWKYLMIDEEEKKREASMNGGDESMKKKGIFKKTEIISKYEFKSVQFWLDKKRTEIFMKIFFEDGREYLGKLILKE